jgi:Holliday junction resolvasome RuvABC DNA-binding subunit
MATETPTKIIVDCSTGEQVSVPLTAEEIAQLEADAAAAAVAEAERVAAEEQKAADKADAIAALIALGLTEAQIAALTA